jgi:hypothetical protein
MTQRIPIRFDKVYEIFSKVALMPPDDSYIDVGEDEIEVRMSYGFRTRFPRSAVADVSSVERRPWSRGIHGWNGRWLVNGSGRGIVQIDLEPRQRAYVCGIPVRLRQLLVSVDDPEAAASALT